MNTTFGLNKDFGELTTKKAERILNSFNENIGSQQIEGKILAIQFESGALILNYDNREIAFAFPDPSSFDDIYEKYLQLLDLLDLENEGLMRIVIEEIETFDYSIGELSKSILPLDSDISGVGFRVLIDTESDFPKEVRIEPSVDDLTNLYKFGIVSCKEPLSITKEFIKDSVQNIETRINKYKTIFLEKGGYGG